MSLTSYIKRKEVAARLKPFRIKPPRKIGTPKVEPKTKRYDIIGTAFDYLLRFELQRRDPHAKTRALVAESVPEMLWSELPGGGSGGFDLFHDSPDYMPPKEASKRARLIVDNAKSALAAYLTNPSPSQAIMADLAGHAIRLANLDPVVRAIRLSPDFENVDALDVQDLLAMFEITPLDAFLHNDVLLLNPSFGDSSELVGGADCDLIVGDNLIELKTTKALDYQAESLDQLLGYFILARNERRHDSTFPDINRLSLYFCRHQHFVHVDAAHFTANQEFGELESWFISHAKEVHP